MIDYILDVSYFERLFHIELVFLMGKNWKWTCIKLVFLHVKKKNQKSKWNVFWHS